MKNLKQNIRIFMNIRKKENENEERLVPTNIFVEENSGKLFIAFQDSHKIGFLKNSGR